MRVLCSFPGRSGDLLWALPTLRALAETIGEPVDLCLSPQYGSLKDLIERQLYIGRCWVAPGWEIRETAPMTPREPPGDTIPSIYDQVFHLGYDGWPPFSLPKTVEAILHQQWPDHLGPVPTIDLDRPWIAPPYPLPTAHVVCGWSEEHFELKVGLTHLLRQQLDDDTSIADYRLVNVSTSPRWQAETPLLAHDWLTAAAWIGSAKVFVGCCSALHVLAVAMGTRAIVVEPNAQRQQDLFWPLGMDGDGNGGKLQILRGNDRLPTVDARHLWDVVKALGREGVRRG